MKIKLSLLVILGVLTFSCEDFLEEEVLADVTSGNFYNSNKDLEQAINAVYGNINYQWRGNMTIYGDLMSEDITVGFDAQDASDRTVYDNFTFDNQNWRLDETWDQFYKAIDDANVVIEKAPGASEAQESLKLRVVAEAYFLRAYAHFTLVRLYGEVPLKTESTQGLGNTTPEKNSISEIYAQIVTDLQIAAGETESNPGLPEIYSGADLGRVTVGSALALLAEVQLTNKNWAAAAEYAQKVINSGDYALWPTYKEAFMYTNKFQGNSAPNGEAIFEAQFNQDVDPGNPLTWNTYPRSSVQGFAWGGLGNYVATPEAYNSFQDGDERKNVIFPEYYQNTDGDSITINQPDDDYFLALKWTRNDQPTALYGWDANNQPILRYADVLLIYAEASNELSGPSNDAYDAVNQLRTRANLPPLSGLDQNAFREAIYNERRHEFFLEGKRFFDLVRTGRFVSTMNATGVSVTESDQRLPIPQSEIDLNDNLGAN